MKYAFNLPTRGRNIGFATVLIVVTFMAAIFAIFVVQYDREFGDRLHRAERVAQAVENHLRLVFERIDAILLQAELELGGRDLDAVGPVELETIRRRAIATAPAGFDLAFWRRDGTTPLPGSAPGPVNIRDREIYTALFDPAFPADKRAGMLNPASGNLVGAPGVARLRSGWIVPVARPLRGSDGLTIASLGVTVPLAALLNGFETLLEGPNDALFLLRLDHMILARLPEGNNLIGRQNPQFGNLGAIA